MDYREYFRSLRKAGGFTHETLAAKAGCHRNTVLNVERRRPVKFRTIGELMSAMGYGRDSEEVRRMALLWLEAVSGIALTYSEVQAKADDLRLEYSQDVQGASEELMDAITQSELSRERIRLLTFAARHPGAIDAIGHVRDLLTKTDGRDGHLDPRVATDGGMRLAKD